MPWKRAKALPPPDNTLFETCFRIRREACEAAGRHIPLVVENVRGAQPWVGRARWNYGSFYLWGDVPALMPYTFQGVKIGGGIHSKTGFPHDRLCDQAIKIGGGANVPGIGWTGFADTGASWRNREVAIKNNGGSWFNIAHNTTSGKGQNPDGRKGVGSGAEWFDQNLCSLPSASPRRKAASAMIARIPLPLARHIAAVWAP
jgi:hypothetical protein